MPLDELMACDLQWRKTRHSANNGACVEVAQSDTRILIRDSKNPGGPALNYPQAVWRTFVLESRTGHHDMLSAKS